MTNSYDLTLLEDRIIIHQHHTSLHNFFNQKNKKTIVGESQQ